MKGLLLVNKTPGSTSFHIVSLLRSLTKEKTIGHAGTLDPFATGVMVMLIGREFTRRSNEFLCCDKQYQATLRLGLETDTYDLDGRVTFQSQIVPTLLQVKTAIASFQGIVHQVPPMFSAKKIQGRKLYDLARKGISVKRESVKVDLNIELIRYHYPDLELVIECSKGTYIRSLGHDLGKALQCGAHLSKLTRLRSGPFLLEECVDQELLKNQHFEITPFLKIL